MGPLQLALLLAGVFAAPALGGSAVWEATTRHRLSSPVQHQRIAVDAAGYAIADDEAAHSHLSKRYSATDGPLWPDRTVSFCYETQEGRDQLHTRFKAATKLWHAAGLKKDKYKYVEVTSPGAGCTGHPDRAVILVIKLVDAALRAMSATVGIPPMVADDPSYVGPVASLSVWRTASYTAESIAHELGHVWGLYHEHQYPGFWMRPYSDWDPQDPVENEAMTEFGRYFDCQSIRGYTEALDLVDVRLADHDLATRNKVKADLCTSQGTAEYYNFFAGDWLPQMLSFKTNHVKFVAAGKGHVDWQSIMLYGSYAGTGVEGNPVLRDSDGATFSETKWPSESDVFAIKSLYADAEVDGKKAPKLHFDPASRWRLLWHEMRMRRWGCWP